MIRFTNIALVLVFIVIGLGALTRLLDAGLGCPDWPGCYGFLTPPNHSEHIEIAESLYPETPVVRHQAWMEMVHRYAAGSLGLIIFTLTWLGYRSKKPSIPRVRFITTALSLIVILQAAFGMWTVTLKLWPPVVTLHLLGGFMTFGLLIWLRLTLIPSRSTNVPETSSTSKIPTKPPLKRLHTFGLLVFIVLVAQISLGAWTSSNYAGLACPDFPTCQNQWLEHTSLEKAFSIPTYDDLSFLHGRTDAQTRVSIQVFHRIGAMITTVLLSVFLILLMRSQHPLRKPLTLAVASLLGLQIGLGILSAVWLLPLPIALAHNLVAALLFGSFITTLHFVIQVPITVEDPLKSSHSTTSSIGKSQEVVDGNAIPSNS